MPEPTMAMAACIASVPADSLPIQTARISAGSMPARASALRAASMDMVTVSSSGLGTDFSRTGSPPSFPCQTRLISRVGRRWRGIYAP